MKFLITFLFLLSYQSYGFRLVVEDGAGKSFAGQDLAELKLVGDFSNANFEGADLSGSKFVGDFSNTDFRLANLNGTDFTEVTSLSGADFSGADLSEVGSNWFVNKFKAVFSGKRFSGDLSNVNFSAANLRGVNFKKSLL